MSQPKKKPPPKKAYPRANDVGVQFYTSREVVDAIDAYLASLPPDKRPTKRGFIEGSVLTALRAAGAWPPPAAPPAAK